MDSKMESNQVGRDGEDMYSCLTELYKKYQGSVIIAGAVIIILMLVTFVAPSGVTILLLMAGLVCAVIPPINYFRELRNNGITALNQKKVYSQIERIAYGEKAAELHSPAQNDTSAPVMVNREMPALNKATLIHVAGLNLPESAKCKVVFRGNVLEVESMSQKIKLSGDKLVGAEIIKKKDISKQAVSSAGGAIAGLALAGVIGGAIGGASHSKTVKTIQKFLAISYLSDDEVKYIVFGADNGKANDICRAISKYTKHKQIEVEL